MITRCPRCGGMGIWRQEYLGMPRRVTMYHLACESCGATSASREEGEPDAAWTGPFDRGWWSACEAFDIAQLDLLDGAPELLDAPAWSTVQRVALPEQLPIEHVRRLLAGPLRRGLRSLRLIGATTPARLAALAELAPRIRELELPMPHGTAASWRCLPCPGSRI